MPADQSPEPVGLEPCPICRSVKTKLQQGGDWAFVECRECGTAGPAWEDPEEAEVSWNTRAPDPELATLRAQLAEAVGALEPFANTPIPTDVKLHYPINYRVVTATYRDVEAARQALAKIKGDK